MKTWVDDEAIKLVDSLILTTGLKAIIRQYNPAESLKLLTSWSWGEIDQMRLENVMILIAPRPSNFWPSHAPTKI